MSIGLKFEFKFGNRRKMWRDALHIYICIYKWHTRGRANAVENHKVCKIQMQMPGSTHGNGKMGKTGWNIAEFASHINVRMRVVNQEVINQGV